MRISSPQVLRLVTAVGLLALVTSSTPVAQGDLQPPTVVSISPASGSTGISTQASPKAVFSEPIANATLSMVIRTSGGVVVPSTLTYDDATRTATADPPDDLNGNSSYNVTVSARDLAGNQMTAPVSWSFTTATPSFQESTVFTGLTNPTLLQFSPDGRVFIGEKSGIIKVFDNLTDTTATVFADLRTNVYNHHDRGLLGMALHPSFPTVPYVYVLYAHDAPIGGSAPRWGEVNGTADPCPNPPGETADGCVNSARLSRLTANGNVVSGPELVLIENWFAQYPSHSIGGLVFGSDGMLYATGGDGASYNFADWGQDGNPLNPGGDPPGGVGATQTPPTAEGGALRSQDLQTNGDPVTLDGTLIRVDPETGLAPPDNPLFNHPDPFARRIVAYGLRNPYRIAARPGTREIWIGDVGWSTWEEINRVVDPIDATADNFGWPCYEGAARQGSYDGANLNICEQLYATGNVTAPFYAYRHGQKTAANEGCSAGSSSIAGLAFYGEGTYPSTFRNALFFADYSRNCLWYMRADAAGVPLPGTIATLMPSAAGPVDLKIGPGGDLFYVSLSGSVRRIRYFSGNQPPTAAVAASPTSGSAPLQVTLSGSGSTDPEGAALTFAWDLDEDGAFDDATGVSTNYTFTTTGPKVVRVRVTDAGGLVDVGSATVLVGASHPVAEILTPSSSLTWTIGEVVAFSGRATDAQDGVLPASALDWDLVIHHCPQSCHVHPFESYANVASGSFVPPDHEYPAWLELRLTATDSSGLQGTTSVLLYPRTVQLTFASNPSGLQLAVGATTSTTPFSRTVMVGSINTVSAISPQGALQFSSWAHGGAATQTITAPATNTTYIASYSGGTTTPNLVAAYGFNETAGTVAADATGNGRTGTVSGATWNASGRFGGALNFDGTNDIVTIADANALDLTTAMTLQAWVYPTNASAWRTAVMKEAPGGLAYTLYANDGSRPSAYLNFGGSDTDATGSSALPLNAWSHLAATYDGATLRLFVNGAQTASRAMTGSIRTTTGALQIGGNSVWGEYFQGRIDEVRVYNRALTAAEIQTDMNSAVAPPGPDTTFPAVSISSPAQGTVVSGPITIAATATDNVGVTSVQFRVDGVNVGAADTTEPFSISWDPSAVPNGNHVLSAVARDGASNETVSATVSVTVTRDLSAPLVNLTSPSAGTVLGTVALSANASDDIGIVSVQFQLNGANFGAADTSAPYSVSWDTQTSANGNYTVTAIARDASGKQTTSTGVTVTVANPPPPAPTGLVAAYGFNETAGTNASDGSGNGRVGTVSGATWTATGRFGGGLSFDGVNDMVTVADANALDLTNGMTLSAWVRPTTLSGWRTAILKEAPSGLSYALYAHDDAPRPAAYVRLGSTDRTAPGVAALPLDAWTHLAATYDGATLRVFINGVQVSAVAMTGSMAASTGALRIGGDSMWGEYFAGVIDEVRIHNRALSTAELQALMAAAVQNP